MKKISVLLFFPLILIILSTIYFENLKSDNLEKLKTSLSSYEKQKKRFAEVDKVKILRANYYSKIFLLDYPVRFLRVSSGFLSDIEKIPGNGVMVTGFKFLPAVGKMDFTLKVVSPNGERAFLQFFGIVEKIKGVVFASEQKSGVKEDGNDGASYSISGEVEIE